MKAIGMVAGFLAGLLLVTAGYAQETPPPGTPLKERVAALEQYVRTIQPTMKQFTQDMFDNVQREVKSQTDRIIGIDPFSKKVSKIETNTGTFLFSIRKVEKRKDGYRLFVNIGNTGLATYSGVTLRLTWGPSWSASDAGPSYAQWRQSLRGAEYKFSGALKPGSWTEFTVDVGPVQRKDFEYLECQMDVDSVALSNAGG